MGRWAQVYFTNPPEKRDEAVHELLRQLEAENSTRSKGAAASSSFSATSSIASAPAVSSSHTEAGALLVSPPSSQESQGHTTLVRCLACGRKNSSTQRFCGLCGTRLGEEGAVAALHRNDLPGDLPIEDVQSVTPHGDSNSDPRSDFRSHHDTYEPSVYEPPLNTNELSLFQNSGDASYYGGDSDQILSTPGSSGSYRIYVIFVVAIFLGAIAYFAWRSAQPSQARHAEPATPSTATEEPAVSPPAAPGPSKTDTLDRTPATENSVKSAAPEADKPSRKQARSRADKAAAPAPRNARPETNSPSSVSATGGAEELAVAQGYLNGTNGQGRNGAEAAKWLWKAIAKHNAGATFLLSDLYLKGDGVTKNCDQARVLLDTATLKGVKGAGERLRHLQAFGCQ